MLQPGGEVLAFNDQGIVKTLQESGFENVRCEDGTVRATKPEYKEEVSPPATALNEHQLRKDALRTVRKHYAEKVAERLRQDHDNLESLNINQQYIETAHCALDGFTQMYVNFASV